MGQRTPEVGEEDARRILLRDYPPADFDSIWKTIESLEVREKWRVVLGCLKNGAGSTEKLRWQLEDAPGYYREIVGEAEYPKATKRWSRFDRMSEEERQALYDEDWRQYEAWLRR